MRRTFPLFLAFILCVASLAAEPSGFAKLLIEEKTSIFDLGTLRIQAKLDIAAREVKKTVFSVSYNEKSDKLELLGVVQNKFASRADAEAAARDLFTRIRQELTTDPKTGIPATDEKKQQECLARLFSSISGSEEFSAEKIGPYLRSAIEFELRLSFGTQILQCRGTFAKKDLDFFVKDSAK